MRMNSVQPDINRTIIQKLLKWLFFILTLCTIVTADLAPKEDEETKPTLVNIVLYLYLYNSLKIFIEIFAR